MPRISIVTSLFRVAPYIEEFYSRSRAALDTLSADYEFVFVDDGSPDESRDVVLRLLAKDPKVRLVELSRNFGQHRALWIGLGQARGDLIFMVDADLEEDPALLATFYTQLNERPGELDVVYGVMQKRTGGMVRRLGGSLFYGLMDRLSEVPFPRNVLNARLMTREYVDSLLRFGDAEPFLGALMTLNGFRQLAVPCAKGAKGSTSYTFRRKLRLALDGLFAASTKPLTWIFWGGAWIAAIGLAGVVGTLRSEGGAAAMALASVWLMGGLALVAIGTVGAYVGRVLTQTRGRPVAIIRKIYGASRN